jgi:phosphoadenosine phosphosulfate reductase
LFRPVKEGEDERAGRWKGQAKTECGIHNKRSKYAEFLKQQELKEQEAQKAKEIAGLANAIGDLKVVDIAVAQTV